jgi:hypothetical protein
MRAKVAFNFVAAGGLWVNCSQNAGLLSRTCFIAAKYFIFCLFVPIFAKILR